MNLITYKNFLEAYRKYPYYEGRWGYFRYVKNLVETINPTSVLELGTGCGNLSIVQNEDTMDKSGEHEPTYTHDATFTPWPVEDKQYDLFIALQVWEHLEDKQQEAFKEVMRISNKAILSFPYKWKKGTSKHLNIDEDKIDVWTLGQKPVSTDIIYGKGNIKSPRIIYYFNFDKESIRMSDKCTCRLCKLSIKRKEALESDDIEVVKKALEEFSDLYLNADADASYYQCILDGSWSTAEEILTRSLEKAREHKKGL